MANIAADTLATARTRLAPPRIRTESIDRPRLLNQILDTPTATIVVSGPAGSGKSTLLGQASLACSDAAWLSIDSTDNDSVTLWRAITESLSQVIPGFGQSYRHRLAGPNPRIMDGIVPAAINELIETDQSLHFFVDDVHLLNGDASLRSLEYFIERRPDNVVIVVGGRGQPPFRLSRHRLDRQLVEIGPVDLRLTMEETTAMFDRVGLRLDVHQARALWSRTEGWTAALSWAAMALENEPDIDRFLTSAASVDGDIGRYLAEEVLDRLSTDERDFILETSVLHNLSGELCDAVRGRTDSGQALEKLENSNAMVIRTDRGDGWYRYHHLARDIFESRLQREMPDRVSELHRRAAPWLFDHGEVVQAIHHARAAGDDIGAANMFCASWFRLINRGQIETVLSVFDLLESEARAYQPLAVAAALLHAIAGDDVRSRSFYTMALETSFDGPPVDGSASIEASLAILRASLAFDGVSSALRDAELAYALEPTDSPWQPLVTLALGVANVWSDNLDAALPLFNDLVVADNPDAATRTYALAEIAMAKLAQGDVETAISLATTACDVVEFVGLESLIVAATAHGAAALAHLAAGDAPTAADHLEAAVRSMDAADVSLPLDALRTLLILADAALQLGRLRLAQTLLDKAASTQARIPDAGALGPRLETLQVSLERARTESTHRFGLTGRELDVLLLLPTELSTRQIGAQLYLSKNTAKTYKRQIYRKLGVNTRAGAVMVARRAKLLPEP